MRQIFKCLNEIKQVREGEREDMKEEERKASKPLETQRSTMKNVWVLFEWGRVLYI